MVPITTTRISTTDLLLSKVILDRLNDRPFEQIWMIGNIKILDHSPVGLLCSARCPGSVILKIYDVIRELRDAGVPIIGGFHSPMEKECLITLLRGQQPITICPARSIEDMRVPTSWRPGLDDGRILVISPFESHHRQPTLTLAKQRNNFIAALASALFIPHAAPGSKTEEYCQQQLDIGQTILLLSKSANARLVSQGALPLTPEEIVSYILEQRTSIDEGQ